MPLLFSYGTLQDEAVQLSTYGRRLDGRRDEIVGFEPCSVPIDDPQVAARLGKTHHANASFTGNRDSRVPGTVFDVTGDELTSSDAYERPFAYARVRAALASGLEAWLYVHQPGLNKP